MGDWRNVVVLLQTGLHRRPLLATTFIWCIIYLPLAIGVSTIYPENTFEVIFGEDAIINTTFNQTVYFEADDNVTACLIWNDTGQFILIMAPSNYIPERVMLDGYGKLYTAAPHRQNRTWGIPDDASVFIAHMGNSTPVWTVKITEKRTDVLFYRDRGATLLEGKLLYRDVPTLTPPFINLFWLLPVVLGGSFLVFRLYFAVFALVVTLLVLKLRSYTGAMITVPALFILCNPLTLHSTLFGIQDDIIVTLLFGIALWAFLRHRLNWGAAVVGIGMACKMWSILLVPSLLSSGGPWTKKIGRAAGAITISAISLLPFYLLAPDNTMKFFRLYTTGNSGMALQGISLWRYAGQFGLDPFVMLPLLFVCGVVLLYFSIRQRASALTTGLLFVLLFLLLYPKMHSGYYLPLLLFVALYWERRHMVFAGLIISVGVVGLDTFNGWGWNSGDSALLPLIVASVIWMLILYLFIYTVQVALTIRRDGEHKNPVPIDTTPQTA